MVKTIKSCEIELVSTCFKEEGNKAVIWRLTAGAWCVNISNNCFFKRTAQYLKYLREILNLSGIGNTKLVLIA